jgi:aminoglycoside 3-N-acetyltransferase
MDVTQRDIRQTCHDLNLSGSPLCVHASLRSFGRVEGGPQTVVEGLLAEGCTVMVPTFSFAFALPPPPMMRPQRNGYSYDLEDEAPESNRVFTPQALEIDRRAMGAIPAAVLSMAGHVRGRHPLNSFTAVGPLAHALMDGQRPLDVYRPLEALAALDGLIVLMGVGLTSMTMLHLAEHYAGRTLFRYWARDMAGSPMMVEVGSCSRGFGRFQPALEPFERETTVGESRWRVFPARETLAAATEAIHFDPEITRCDDPSCERCPDAIAGGPILSVTTP